MKPDPEEHIEVEVVRGEVEPGEGLIRQLLLRHQPNPHPASAGAESTADPEVLIRRHLDVVHRRPPGSGVVQVLADEIDGYQVHIAAQDTPLLVESVLSVAASHDLAVTTMFHPVVTARRDRRGRLLGVSGLEMAAEDGGVVESWMMVRAHPRHSHPGPRLLQADLMRVIERVIDIGADTATMTAILAESANTVGAAPVSTSSGTTASDRDEHRQLLEWLAGSSFTLLGHCHVGAGADSAHATGRLGVWRSGAVLRDFGSVADATVLPVFSRVHLPTGVLRSAFPVLVQIPTFGEDGTPSGERRLLGAFTASGVHHSVLDIPVVRGKVAAVLETIGVAATSYSGQAVIQLLENHPPTELLITEAEELARRCGLMFDAVGNESPRLFLRTDPGGSTVSALIHLPRDRYNTPTRLTLQETLARQVGADEIEYTARVSEGPFALLHVLARADSEAIAALGDVDTGAPTHLRLQAALGEAVRTWDERARTHLVGHPEEQELLAWLTSVPAEYPDLRSPRDAVNDIRTLHELADGDVTTSLSGSSELLGPSGRGGQPERSERSTPSSRPGMRRFTVYLRGAPATLSDILPILHSLCAVVAEERPHHLRSPQGTDCWIYEFLVTAAPGASLAGAGIEQRFTDAFERIWRGVAEVDGYNELVARCGLRWREVVMVRAYGRYLRQAGFAYSTEHIVSILGDEPELTEALVAMFETSFDPDVDDGRRPASRAAAQERLTALVAALPGIEADRVAGAFASAILATSRTNFYVPGASVVALKLRPAEIPVTSHPRPEHEVYVYSPRLEGVHFRFGAVARGGLRWSDRREDFRTEVLGLVKAQAVKNAVIVPVGAKGGFVVRRPPAGTSGDDGHRGAAGGVTDREALAAEARECYRQFIGGLLDVTDDLDAYTGEVVPAPRVIAYDAADTYLVVAADKGTATFSDLANDVALERGFWLGDAFASGGSVGYDHKAMGITARGAWESVRRHFREVDIDTQTTDFTVVGIGDMSGDVFGNGMLRSPHIRLVAAFDHRHIFCDPAPSASTSFEERRRLFDLPRSSWDDYDRTLISDGGGVFSRADKAIPISPAMRTALGIDDETDHLAPPDLIRAILLAPVDLIWNGGIGTYVKASTETNSEVGDKANDAIRVDALQLRATVIGEGGNLGVTGAGRIEFALSGGRINTDALDNSGGVDCSDREVNIKIALAGAIGNRTLHPSERDELLESMTDDVADLVLADNIAQNAEVGFHRDADRQRIDVFVRMLEEMSQAGVDLVAEGLPTPDGLAERGSGRSSPGMLSSPELATMMAHVKLDLKATLLAGEVPDHDAYEPFLHRYFPRMLVDAIGSDIGGHRLRREIITTELVNEIVAKAGMTHLFRLSESSGASVADGVRAYTVVMRIFEADDLLDRIAHAGRGGGERSGFGTGVGDDMIAHVRRLVFRASRWLLGIRPQPLAIGAEVARYRDSVVELTPRLAQWFGPSTVAAVEQRADTYRDRGVPTDLATEAAGALHRFCLLDIVDAADITDREPAEVGELYFAVMERFGLEHLLEAASDLEYGDRWHALARLAVRDDMHAALRAITLKILEGSEPDESALQKIGEWEQAHSARLSRVHAVLDEIDPTGAPELAALSVAARALRNLIR